MADDAGLKLESVGIYTFMDDYFDTIREGDIEKIKSFDGGRYLDLHSKLAVYQMYDLVFHPDDDLMPLLEEAYDFSYKIKDISYPDQDTAQVGIEIKNTDTYEVAVDTLEGQDIYELVDGGLNELLEHALDKKLPKMTVPVHFRLKKIDKKWMITDINSEDDMVKGISGNMEKVIEEFEDIGGVDAYYDDMYDIESDLLY